MSATPRHRTLISADTHIAPPYDLADRLPAAYRDQLPHLEYEGGKTWLRNAVFPGMTKAMLDRDGRPASVRVRDERMLARLAHGNVCNGARPSFGAHDLLAELDRDGVCAAVLIGGADGSPPHLPPEVQVAYCRAVNDWQAEEFGDHLDRLAPGIYLPLNDIAASVAELERAASLGLRPALLPDGFWDRPYHLPIWEPLWEAADSLHVPLTMHLGNSHFPPPDEDHAWDVRYPGAVIVDWSQVDWGMLETIGWFVFGGWLTKYPNLTLVLTEGYAGWLAHGLQALDSLWRAAGSARLPDLPPSELVKRQVKVTFMWDPVAIENRDLTGVQCLMWGNDYPHVEGSFPDSVQWLDDQLAGVPDDEVDRIVRANAAETFGFKVAA